MPINGFLYPGAKVVKGYNVDNSLRFNSGDSAELTKTFSSAGNQKTWTFSCWIKRSGISGSTSYSILEAGHGTTPWFVFAIINDKIQVGATAGSTSSWEATSVLRDSSAWYHIVLVVDTTSSTSSISNGSTDRFRVYVNNVQQTLSGGTVPSLNADLQWNGTAGQHMFGASYGQFFDGYACEVAFIDGQALSPSSFGEYDEDSPTIWKPKNISTLTFGTNGFYLDFEDSSSLGNDISGNNHDWTVANLASTDQSTDTCTNNFATLNPLNVPTSNAPTFSEGNLISSTSDSAQFGGTSTIGVSSGKWYAEFKSAETGGEEKEMVGVTHAPGEDARSGDNVGRTAESFAIRFLDGQQSNNNSASAYGSAFSVGDICQVALDIDNNNLYFGKNGQWGDGSGNFNQSTPTSAITIPTIANTTEGAYFFSVGDISSSSGRSLISCNFGSPPFSISSGNADANGHGNFEYAPPSGYFSLCTKNLAESG